MIPTTYPSRHDPSFQSNPGEDKVAVQAAGSLLVHQAVSARASTAPEALAVASGASRLSYAELEQRANQLAQYLQTSGAGPERIVAVWLQRSPFLFVAALGALKAGAAYLPVDPTLPADRVLFMLRDSGARIVITESAMAERIRGAPCPVLTMESCSEKTAHYSPAPPDVEVRPDNLAYVIYTSGSTGVPKGVEITHANLANLISWHNSAFQVTSTDRASHLAGLGFDASVWETWPYLAAGASLWLVDQSTLVSPEALRDWLIANGITVSFVPTPLAERLLSLPWPAQNKLHLLLTGGDTLHVRPAPELPFKVVNNYGPTECTVVATSGVVSHEASSASLPSIGVPIQNTQVYILDEHLQKVAPGERGELYIGGANVGRGYCNHPDMTLQRFVPNPFTPGTRLYRTGDLAQSLPNGEIAFLGRIDNQVKIRGYRIELDEIAAVLNTHPAVTASAVVARGEGEEKRLLAYLVARDTPARSELQEFLLKNLPDYMVPSTFVLVDSLPLTANGKVDGAALPEPSPENTLSDETSAPASEIEASLVRIVAGLLNVPAVGPDDDFFLLGGHSLLGTQLIARVRDKFQVEIALRTLFEEPTVRALSAEIERLLMAKIESMSEEEAQRVLASSANPVTPAA